jgi:hypothetical protein
MRITALPVLATALLVSHAHGAAAPNMKDGLWEITMKMEMAGMPQAMPAQVMQRCITKKDLEDPAKAMPGNSPPDGRCKMTDHKMQGNTATWNIACEDGTAGSGTATYGSTSYTSTNKITSKRGAEAHTMTMHNSGRYLGDCKKP